MLCTDFAIELYRSSSVQYLCKHICAKVTEYRVEYLILAQYVVNIIVHVLCFQISELETSGVHAVVLAIKPNPKRIAKYAKFNSVATQQFLSSKAGGLAWEAFQASMREQLATGMYSILHDIMN